MYYNINTVFVANIYQAWMPFDLRIPAMMADEPSCCCIKTTHMKNSNNTL